MKSLLIFALLVLPAVLLTVDGGSRLMAHAAEDELDEELDVEVEGEDAAVTGQAEETETDDEPETTKSPDADTFLLFTRPLHSAGSGSPAVRKTVETGTTNTKDVDYEWIPAETLKKIQNSPKGGKVSPKQSPRQRKAKRAVGDD